MRNFGLILLLVTLLGVTDIPCWSQGSSEPQTFFKNYAGLSQEQIEEIQHGRTIAKIVDSPTPDEVLVFGAVYIEAAPESTSNLRVVSMNFANSRAIWPSENSAIHLNCLTWTALLSKKRTSKH